MGDNFNKERIIKNTGLLYLRMAFTMWLNLYATRLVLKNLGVDEMGVYGVVGSVVGLFSVFTYGITSTIQRFITFELGKNEGNVNKIFCSSLNIIFLLSAFILILLETGGLWVLHHHINIPEGSKQAAFWVYQLSVAGSLINLVSIPYNALIIAHERMGAFAGISIIQVVLSCAAAYCLSYFHDHRLIIYSAFLFAIGLFIRIIYQQYCQQKFKTEVSYRFMIDKDTMKEMGTFAGITCTSGIILTIASQGIILSFNLIFGVAINAVYAIALQLKNSILSFALNVHKAIAPQITKTYANNEIEKHKRLIYTGCKIQVFMILIIMIPFLFRTEYIMQLWLGEVPPYAVTFAQCTVFISLTYAFFEPIRTAVLATNRIKHFMLVPDCFYLLAVPMGFLIGKLTNNPNYMLISVIIMDVVSCGIRTYIASRVSAIKIREVSFQVIVPCCVTLGLSSIVCYLLSTITLTSIIGISQLLLANCFVLLIIIYVFGLSSTERQHLHSYILLKRNSKCQS